MKENAVLVDVATVKVHTTELLERYAKGRYWVAMHPMWGPQSYKKTSGDIRGYRLVVTGHALPRRVYKQLRTAIRATGIRVVEMTPVQHDSLLAHTLFVTHYIGQIISFAGLRRTEIDSVSFGYLMDAVDSVENDMPLFLDVLRFNRAQCISVMERIGDAEHRLRMVMDGEQT